MNGRNQDGTFQVGCKPGPGRPRKPTEAEYQAVLCEVMNLDEWRAIVARAVLAAKDNDPAARSWLGKHVVAPRPLKVDVSSVTTHEVSDEQIQEFVNSLTEEQLSAFETVIAINSTNGIYLEARAVNEEVAANGTS